MASLDSVSIAILLGAALVMAGILSSLLALRFGAPLLLVFLMIGVIAGGQAGLGAVLYYLFVYMFMNFGAFAVVTLLAGPEGDRDSFADLQGLGRRNPVLAIAMSVFMLSLAGFPPSVGFFDGICATTSILRSALRGATVIDATAS